MTVAGTETEGSLEVRSTVIGLPVGALPTQELPFPLTSSLQGSSLD